MATSPAPATPSLLRALNDRAALDLLLEHGHLSRSQIGRLTGLSKPTASQLLARLESADLVRVIGTSDGAPGRNAVLYSVNPSAGYAAAADVTPSRIQAAVADIAGTVVGSFELRTLRGAHQASANAIAAVAGAAASAGLALDDLDSAVIGTPGSFDPATQQLRYAKHLSGWHREGILSELAGALGTEVRVENDVNLAALAEHRVGATVGCGDFVLFWADEGLGGALMLGGQLYRGATGGAGEIGFMQGPGDLVRMVRRENSGGFQLYAGPAQLLPLGRSLGLRGRNAATMVAQAVSGEATDGPGRCAAYLDEVAMRFAAGLASVIAIVDPAVVVLAGAMARAGGEALRARVESQLAELAMARPAVVLSTVRDNPVLTGGLGAALDNARNAVFATG